MMPAHGPEESKVKVSHSQGTNTCAQWPTDVVALGVGILVPANEPERQHLVKHHGSVGYNVPLLVLLTRANAGTLDDQRAVPLQERSAW